MISRLACSRHLDRGRRRHDSNTVQLVGSYRSEAEAGEQDQRCYDRPPGPARHLHTGRAGALARLLFHGKVKANNLDLDPGAMGIMFGYRDAKNYYRFSMDRKASARRLVKVVNGLVTLLAADNVAYDLSRFYTLEAKMAKGKIEIWVDLHPLFAISDVSHNSGKVGIYASDHGGLAVDYALVNELEPTAFCTYSITPSQASFGAPQVRVQWTSRLPAGVVGRRLQALPGLPLPLLHRIPAMGSLPIRYPRIRLQCPVRAH